MKFLSKIVFGVVAFCCFLSTQDLFPMHLRLVEDRAGKIIPTDWYVRVHGHVVDFTPEKDEATKFVRKDFRGSRCVTRQSGLCEIKLGKWNLITDDCGVLNLVYWPRNKGEMLCWDRNRATTDLGRSIECYRYEVQGCCVMLMSEAS